MAESTALVTRSRLPVDGMARRRWVLSGDVGAVETFGGLKGWLLPCRRVEGRSCSLGLRLLGGGGRLGIAV